MLSEKEVVEILQRYNGRLTRKQAAVALNLPYKRVVDIAVAHNIRMTSGKRGQRVKKVLLGGVEDSTPEWVQRILKRRQERGGG